MELFGKYSRLYIFYILSELEYPKLSYKMGLKRIK